MSQNRRPSVSDLAGAFGENATKIRREGFDDEADGFADPGEPAAEADTGPPAILRSTPRPAAATTRPRRASSGGSLHRAKPGLDSVGAESLKAQVRRVVAARRKLDDRMRDLARSVDERLVQAEAHELAAFIVSQGLPLEELPADLAARLVD